MNGKTKTSLKAILAGLGVLVAATAAGQSPPPAATQDDMSMHHQRLFKMMKDMIQEMSSMTEQMSRTDLTSEQRKQMAERMEKDVGHDASHVGPRSDAGHDGPRAAKADG